MTEHLCVWCNEIIGGNKYGLQIVGNRAHWIARPGPHVADTSSNDDAEQVETPSDEAPEVAASNT
jgi:hypothetical protein